MRLNPIKMVVEMKLFEDMAASTNKLGTSFLRHILQCTRYWNYIRNLYRFITETRYRLHHSLAYTCKHKELTLNGVMHTNSMINY